MHEVNDTFDGWSAGRYSSPIEPDGCELANVQSSLLAGTRQRSLVQQTRGLVPTLQQAARAAGNRKTRHRRVRRSWVSLVPAIAAVLGIAGYLVLSDGGRLNRQTISMTDAIDRAAAKFGFGVRQIELIGYRQTDPKRALDILSRFGEQSVFGVSDRATHAALMQLPWVKRAVVERIWPDRLRITLEEREAHAVWLSSAASEHDRLIDENGSVLARVVGTLPGRLPRIAGHNGGVHAGLILRQVSQFPAIVAAITRYDRVGDRRWTLRLTRGRSVLLPVDGRVTNALVRLDRQRWIDRLPDGMDLDLRLPDRLVVRPAAKAGTPRHDARAAIVGDRITGNRITGGRG